MSCDINKDELMALMAENLLVLRNKLRLTQIELAGKVGINRQTLIGIEKKKRPMTWNTFVALLAVFRANSDTSNLLDYFGIYTTDLKEFLTSPDSVGRD